MKVNRRVGVWVQRQESHPDEEMLLRQAKQLTPALVRPHNNATVETAYAVIVSGLGKTQLKAIRHALTILAKTDLIGTIDVSLLRQAIDLEQDKRAIVVHPDVSESRVDSAVLVSSTPIKPKKRLLTYRSSESGGIFVTETEID